MNAWWSRLVVGAVVVLLLGIGGLADPAFTRAHDATAAATPGGEANDPGGLAALLDRLPAVPFSEPSIPVSYADVAAQLAAVGVAAPTAGADQAASARFWDAAKGLWLPSSLSRSADPAWRAAFGFDLFQIDQAIGLNVRRRGREQDFNVMLVRGRFAEAEVRAAWMRSGYQTIEVEGGELASVGEEA